jgi:hypothetical protein
LWEACDVLIDILGCCSISFSGLLLQRADLTDFQDAATMTALRLSAAEASGA